MIGQMEVHLNYPRLTGWSVIDQIHRDLTSVESEILLLATTVNVKLSSTGFYLFGKRSDLTEGLSLVDKSMAW